MANTTTSIVTTMEEVISILNSSVGITIRQGIHQWESSQGRRLTQKGVSWLIDLITAERPDLARR